MGITVYGRWSARPFVMALLADYTRTSVHRKSMTILSQQTTLTNIWIIRRKKYESLLKYFNKILYTSSFFLLLFFPLCTYCLVLKSPSGGEKCLIRINVFNIFEIYCFVLIVKFILTNTVRHSTYQLIIRNMFLHKTLFPLLT